MKILVFSWFYPPTTTSEAIVTYKLLSDSENEYDVVSCKSKKWSYKIDSKLTSDNIKEIYFEDEELEDFTKHCVEFFEKNKEKYDAIMTRAYPPEDHYIGVEIKKKYPNVKWIASSGDPISKNPYETTSYFLLNRHKIIRKLYSKYPNKFIKYVCQLIPGNTFRHMNKMYKLDEDINHYADILIYPSLDQAKFCLDKNYDRFKYKVFVVPHTYKENMYERKTSVTRDKIIFTYLGHLDGYRSPEVFIKSMKLIKTFIPDISSKMEMWFVGNVPSEMKDMANVFFLDDVIKFKKPVNYMESIHIMESSDCLLHVDARFAEVILHPIFFAAKLADYIGSNKMILGVTPRNSVASKIIKEVGGRCIEVDTCFPTNEEIVDLSKIILEICDCGGEIKTCNEYSSKTVSKKFDEEIKERFKL